MDFNFDIDNDQYLENSFIEEHIEEIKVNDFIQPHFNCSEYNTDGFHKKSFIRCDDINRFLISQNNILNVVFNQDIHLDLLCDSGFTKRSFQKASQIARILKVSANNEYDSVDKTEAENLRMKISNFLHTIRKLDPQRYHVAEMRSYIWKLVLSHGTFGFITDPYVNLNEKEFQYIHGQLDWSWLCLTTLLKFEIVNNNLTMEGTQFEKLLKIVIYDLITKSMDKFNATNINDLINNKPFVCACFKEYWLLLQLILEKYNLSFWSYFNNTLKLIQNPENINQQLNEMGLMRNKKTPDIKNYDHFVIWMLEELSDVQGYNENGCYVGDISYRIIENYEYLEDSLNTFLNSNPSEEDLRVYIMILKNITSLWPPRTEIIMTLWNYFHKILNSSFFIRGASFTTMTVPSNNPQTFVDQLKTNINKKLNLTQTSFTMFISTCHSVIQKFKNLRQTNQINKILGRIYSKLPHTKLVALNETGITNIGSLLLTLALSTDIKETGQKISEIILQIPFEKLNECRAIALTKIHFSLLLMFIENNINIENYVFKFLTQLNNLIKNEPGESKIAYSVMKIIIQTFDLIYLEKVNYDLGEHLLIDSWITKYLELSSNSELDRFCEIINKILLNLHNDNENTSKIRNSIYQHILPFVKMKFHQINYSKNVTNFTSNLCILTTDKDSLSRAFT